MIRRELSAAGHSGALVDIGVVDLHQAAGACWRPAAETGVEAVGIGGGDGEATQSLQLGMVEYGCHQCLAVAAAAILWQHEHVGQIAEGGPVCDDPSEGDLLTAELAAKAERMVDGPLQGGKGNAATPVGLFRQETVDQRQVEPPLVGADFKRKYCGLHPGSLPRWKKKGPSWGPSSLTRLLRESQASLRAWMMSAVQGLAHLFLSVR